MDKTNSSWLKTFSIGLSIVSFGITLAILGYVLTTQKNKAVNQQPNTTIQPSPTHTTSPFVLPTTDPSITANWKTYRNEAFGFEFKYPDDLLLVKNDNESEYGKRYNVSLKVGFTQHFGYPPPELIGAIRLESKLNYEGRYGPYKLYPVEVWVFDNSSNLSAREYFNQYGYYPFSWGDPKPFFAIQKSVSVGNSEALTTPYLVNPGDSRQLYIHKGQKVFLINISGRPMPSLKSDQILSTFQFTQ